MKCIKQMLSNLSAQFQLISLVTEYVNTWKGLEQNLHSQDIVLTANDVQ